jgi:hypothetical protein
MPPIPLAENRFLQAGNGAENTKGNIQAVLFTHHLIHLFLLNTLEVSQLGSFLDDYLTHTRQVTELKISRKNPDRGFTHHLIYLFPLHSWKVSHIGSFVDDCLPTPQPSHSATIVKIWTKCNE